MDQLGMYGTLVYNVPGLDESRILQFFKDASFGVRSDDIARMYAPTSVVTVIRDASFGVPHIFGTTRGARCRRRCRLGLSLTVKQVRPISS
jgi:hypothetical protein